MGRNVLVAVARGIAALVACVLVGVAVAGGASAQDRAEAMQANVVAVTVGASLTGFGVIVGERGGVLTIVTANHVVRTGEIAPGPISVRFFGREEAEPAKLLDEALLDLDVAVIQAAAPAGLRWERRILATSTDVRRGDSLWFIGRPGPDWTVGVAPGVFSKRDVNGLLHAERLGIAKGNSGGPLVAKSGLLGILTNSKSDFDTVAVPFEVISNAFSVDNWNLPWDLHPSRSRVPFSTFADCPDCPDLVAIPGGTFLMGSDPSTPWPDKTSQPMHEVKLAYDFAIGQMEVTGPQWLACVRAGGCTSDLGYRIDPNLRTPVQFIRFKDAHDYVSWLSRRTGARYRLPSEAEWEYVARGGGGSVYPWGDAMDDVPAVCWGCKGAYDGSVTRAVAPVGRFPPNKFNVYDMSGNISELLEDCWFDDYVDAPVDGRPWLADGCTRRVIRGGSYLDPVLSLRVFARHPTWANDGGESTGFRVVREMPN